MRSASTAGLCRFGWRRSRIKRGGWIQIWRSPRFQIGICQGLRVAVVNVSSVDNFVVFFIVCLSICCDFCSFSFSFSMSLSLSLLLPHCVNHPISLSYPLIQVPGKIRSKHDFTFDFQTSAPEGLLFYVSGDRQTDFISVFMKVGIKGVVGTR